MNVILKESDNLIELKNWWFSNKQYWFNSIPETDKIITERYQSLFYSQLFLDRITSIEAKLGYIILRDQVYRHIIRHKKIKKCSTDIYFKNITKFAYEFCEKYKHILSNNEFCFALLPLRHTNIFKNQEYTMNQAWLKIKCLNDTTFNNEVSINIYKNFLKAAYERASEKTIYLLDLPFDKYEKEIEEKDSMINENMMINTIENPYNVEFDIDNNIMDFIWYFQDILDKNVMSYSKEDFFFDFDKNKIVNECKKISPNTKIILSISGGIDSMILSWIFKELGLDFVMVHINYSNREECEKEKEFLCHWKKYINKDLYVRDIYEINRKDCMKYDMRKIYESYTRDVRYNAYVQIMKKMSWRTDNCIIILGHNHDDCFENILTNIKNKQNYTNLEGMEYYSLINFKDDNITFCRPMVDITKKEIFEFAHSNLIPYLYDSTPKWSQRGQIRDIVKPTLEKWSPEVINGFHNLKSVLSDSLECVDMLVNVWIEKKYKSLEYYFDASRDLINRFENTKFSFIKIKLEELVENEMFWNRLLIKLGMRTSIKSLNNLMLKIHLIKEKFYKTDCNKITTIVLCKEHKFYYWRTIETESRKSKLIFSFNDI